MASKYWIKLYHEILDDPKMGRMPDQLWRRTIELFLVAGEVDREGILPPVGDMAYRLRVDDKTLQNDLDELEKKGIIYQKNGRYIVSKFADRQGPMSSAERVRRFRSTKRKEEYNESHFINEQNSNVVSNENVTNRSQIRLDKIRKEKKRKEKTAIANQNKTKAQEVFEKILFEWSLRGVSGKAAIERLERCKIKDNSRILILIPINYDDQEWLRYHALSTLNRQIKGYSEYDEVQIGEMPMKINLLKSAKSESNNG